MSETLVKQLDIVKRTLKEAGKDVCVSAVNEAVGEIKRLQAELDKVKRERDGLSVIFEREFKDVCKQSITLHNEVMGGKYANTTPEGSIYAETAWIENRWQDITDPLFTTHFEALAKRDKQQQIKALEDLHIFILNNFKWNFIEFEYRSYVDFTQVGSAIEHAIQQLKEGEV